jgi:signal transduction histidine kinase/ActR/RegA family two-component response regulator
VQLDTSSRALPRGYWQGRAGQLIGVVLGIGTAIGLRMLMNPWLGPDSAPFITAFPVVAAVAFFAGVGPGAVTAVGCTLWVAMPGMPPNTDSAVGLTQVAVFLPSSFIVAFLAGQASPLTLEEEAREIDAGRPGLVRWLRWSMLLAAGLPALFFAVAAWSTYVDAIDDAKTRIDRAARVGVEHASKVIETNEAITRHVMSALDKLTLEQARAREGQLYEQLRTVAADIPQVQSVWIMGADGRAVASSRVFPAPRDVDFSDREGLKVHAAGEPGPHVTAPNVGRITGETFFDVTTRWNGPDGRFQGAVWVSLHPAYFSDFYAGQAKDEPGLTLTLLRADGTVLARFPRVADLTARFPPTNPMIQQIAAGSQEGSYSGGESNIDGVDRIVSYRKVDKYPVYVSAGIAHETVLGEWQKRAALLAAFTFPTAMALIYMSWVALRRTRRELAAVRELHLEIEHRARAESALRQVQKLEALGRLTGGVAHDFNNLLMVVSNNLQLLKKLEPSLDGSKQVAAIGRAVSTGERLTRQLLAFARRQPLNPEVISLQERLPALLTLVAPTLGARIEATCTVAPDTASIEVDAAELELAVINMAVNARDAMPDGGMFRLAARNATAEEAERPGEFVVISATDSGSGIDPAIIDLVFEPFFTTKPHGQGTGLGLSQVYGFCTQSGGSARINSVAGRGTEIRLLLPAVAARVGTASRPPTISIERIDCTILLVEDNEELAATLRPLLEQVGCIVEWASSGDAARAVIDRRPGEVDVVLSDMAMPGELDGLGLAAYLRSHHPMIGVVLMTGYASQLHEAAARGFPVLAKPCAPDVVLNAIRAVCRNPTADAMFNARSAGAD